MRLIEDAAQIARDARIEVVRRLERIDEKLDRLIEKGARR